MNKRNDKQAILANIVILLGILIFVNLISINFFRRIDLSKGKIYSLSRSSIETVRQLPNRIIIKAYFTRNLPGQYADLNRYTRDLLSEYQAYSRGRLRFEFIDPSDEERLRQEAQRNQIMPVSMRVIEDDKLEVREVYMGLAFLYEGETETIPLIQSTRGLEYDITSTIKSLTDIDLRRIGLFTSDDPPPPTHPQFRGQQPTSNYSRLRELITSHYELVEIDLEDDVPTNLDVLIFGGVNDSLSLEQHYHLDQYLMSGGNLLLFQNRVDVDFQNQVPTPIESNIFDLLKHYGIKIDNNLVADANSGQINVQMQQGIFTVNRPVQYPFLPIVNSISSDNIITDNLENLQFIFASRISEPINDRLTMTPLIFSSENSSVTSPPDYRIGIDQYMNRDLRQIFRDGPVLMSALFEGFIESYYIDMFPEDRENYPEFGYENPNAKIIVVADHDLIQDHGAISVPGNLAFILNSIDYLVDDTVLINLRTRETEFRPLREIGSNAKKVVRWINIILPSIILIIFGILNYHHEVKKRKYIGELYEKK